MSLETTTHSSPNNSYVVERNGIVTGLEQIPYTVLATAGARVYHTKLTDKEDQWTYSRWKGNLSFCRDIDNPISLSRGASEVEKHWFRLADENTGRTVWMFRLPEQFEYKIDRPFFHVFQGRTRRYGFLFNDDDEAALFGQKVISHIYNGRGYPRQKFTLYQILADLFRARLELPKKTGGSKTSRPTTRSKSLSAGGHGSASIKRSMISVPAPNSFRHVTHIGVGKDGVFEASTELDDSWKTMLASLQGYGVSEEMVIRHSDFVEGFWKGVEAVRTVDGETVDESVQKEMNRKMTTISAI